MWVCFGVLMCLGFGVLIDGFGWVLMILGWFDNSELVVLVVLFFGCCLSIVLGFVFWWG